MGIGTLFSRRGVIASALEPLPALPEPMARQRFAVGSDIATWNALVANGMVAGRISRREAASVPAVKRARDLIAGTLGTLPLHAVNSAGLRVDHALLNQPESLVGLTRSISIAKTIEDLLYEGASLWLVLLRTSAGFPSAVQRIAYSDERVTTGRTPSGWQQNADTGEISVAGRVVDPRDVILFSSPNDPLLVVGARAIRALLQQEQTAALYASEPEAATNWRAADGIDPPEEDVLAFLTAWVNARKRRATAFIPSSFTRDEPKRLTPEEMQLISAREACIKDVARLTGVDAEELSVSTTSRTYANITQRRMDFVSFTLGPYAQAIEERLSLGDVTPRGTYVKFAYDGFLRADTAERYASYAVALTAGFLTVDEVRELEDRPPMPNQTSVGMTETRPAKPTPGGNDMQGTANG